MPIKPRVIIVEDESDAAEFTRLHLQNLGYDVVATVSSGKQAVEYTRRLQPDLILMDVVLEGEMDGIEAAQRIRQHLDIPIVYLSAYADERLLKRAITNDAFGYLVKPYTERELSAALSVAIHKSKTEIKLKDEASLSNTLMSLCEGLMTTDIEGKIQIVNPAAIRLSRFDYDELIGKLFHDVVTLLNERTHTPLTGLVDSVLQKGETTVLEDVSLVNNDGEKIAVHVGASPVTNQTGSIVGAAIMLRDVRANHKIKQALQQSEKNFRKVAETTAGSIVVYREKILYANPASKTLSGYTIDELLRMSILDLVHPEYKDEAQERVQMRLKGIDRPLRYETKFVTKSGDERWLDISSSTILYEGKPAGLMTAFDITDHKRTEVKLQQEKEKAQTTLESIGEGVITTDITGNIEYLNPMATQLTGWGNTEAKGMHHSKVLILFDADSGKAIDDPVMQCLESKQYLRPPERLTLQQHNTDKKFTVELTISPIKDHNGAIIGTVLFLHDVTRMHGMEQQLSYQATHDPLTGLINRREFESRLQAALNDTHNNGNEHALCYLDLDQFKIVNDTCGHIAGDELLKQLASQLQLCIRKDDTLARLGGDEFGALLTDCPMPKAQKITDKLLNAVKQFRFTWQEKVFEIGVSIGLMPVTSLSGSLAEVMSTVDSACYVAKDKGRNHIHVFQPNDIAISKRQGEMQWVQRINQAFAESRFKLYYQKVEALNQNNSDHPEYHELLLRLVGEDGQIFAPAHFIPAAERYHIMPAVDHWVVKAAFEILARRQATLNGSRIYAINLSGQSLGDESFIDFVSQQLQRSGAPTRSICFEITETAAITNIAMAMRFITTLKDMGCYFALDDFGTGLSSFEYLKNLPVDFLKIDGGFVRNMVNDPINYAIVESINQIGHVMGIKTIAESVENSHTLTALRALNVDYAQGREIGMPLAVGPFSETGLRPTGDGN